MTRKAEDENPRKFFERILGCHFVDARIHKLTVHDTDLPPVSAHFLYPEFKAGKPSVSELVKMLMGELTAFCATKTIDYICWCFRPSMYFRRDGKSLRIGDLLIRKAKEAHVKIRILCWLDSAWIAQIGEQEVPGWTKGARFMTQNVEAQAIAYDRNWYHYAQMPRGGRPSNTAPAGSQMYTALRQDPYQMFGSQSFRDIGIELVTRDFSMDERAEIMHRERLMRASGDGPTLGTIGAYGAESPHHQKMVLIDYEAPEVAVGFVMGHNTLDAYWDDDGYSYAKKAPDLGRNGDTPRQDMSAMVAGPILEHLNDNFCRAWQRDAKEDLFAKRNGLEKLLQPREQIRDQTLVRVMAQINRTQSQEGVRNIEKLYLQAVNNATKFIYVENQYFRWPALAEKIKSAVQAQICAGREAAKSGPPVRRDQRKQGWYRARAGNDLRHAQQFGSSRHHSDHRAG